MVPTSSLPAGWPHIQYIMNLSNKTVWAHGGCFDKNCATTYRQNSKEVCEASSKREYIGVIELDVRKSSDGILYCFHGNLFQYNVTLRFPRSLKRLQEKYGVHTLKEILNVITPDKIVFLDIKDDSITKEDVLDSFKGKVFKEIVLGNKSSSLLQKFSGMPESFVKILNGNIFCSFYDLKKLKRQGFKYLEVVFPFQIHKKIIDRVEKAGMEISCAPLFFLSTKSYWRKIEKYRIKHVSSDFI